MTTSVQRRRGSTTQHSTFTGLEGEITIDTTKDTAVIHDGSTVGGFPLAKENLSNATPVTLNAIAGAATADDDLFLIYDSSTNEMKKITRAELNNAIEADALASVTITGGSINGTTIGASTASTGAFTTLAYSSTFTGGTGVFNLGSGQFYKDASGNIGVGTSSPTAFSGYTVVDAYNGTTGAFFLVRNPTKTGQFAVDTNGVRIGSRTNDYLSIVTNDTDRVRIDSSGNVGVGTTTMYGKFNSTPKATYNAGGTTWAEAALSATGSYGGGLSMIDGSAGYGLNVEGSGGSFVIRQGTVGSAPTERMRINPSGLVGIGTSSPSKKLEIYATSNSLQILSVVRNDQAGSGVAAIGFNTASTGGGEATSTKAGIGLERGAAFGGGALCFYNNNSGSAGDFTTADEKMRISSSGNLGIGLTNPSAVLHLSRGGAEEVSTKYTNGGGASSGFVVGANNSGVGLVYHIDSKPIIFATANTERMRIDSDGLLLIGASGYVGSGTTRSGIAAWNAGNAGRINIGKTVSGAADGVQFNYNGTSVGYIQYTDTATSYVTSSDYRLKENIAPMVGALDLVQQLKPVTYNWKSDGSSGQGFIAHELQAIVPDCVTGEKDAVDSEGKPVYQGIDTSFLVATLTAAIKEQQAIIENLTTRLTALEGK